VNEVEFVDAPNVFSYSGYRGFDALDDAEGERALRALVHGDAEFEFDFKSAPEAQM